MLPLQRKPKKFNIINKLDYKQRTKQISTRHKIYLVNVWERAGQNAFYYLNNKIKSLKCITEHGNCLIIMTIIKFEMLIVKFIFQSYNFPPASEIVEMILNKTF